jgi:hypothetical protein
MADLLECLIQVKALREALEMVTGSISGEALAEIGPVTVSGVWQRMADAERRYAQALGTTAGSRRRTASEAERPVDARDRFMDRRRANLAMLEGCTAAQLAGFVEWPGRPSTTVADLVAIMLAHDTDALGALRRTRARRAG